MSKVWCGRSWIYQRWKCQQRKTYAEMPLLSQAFTYDDGQLTHYSHQDESKWDQLIVDTFSQVPIEKSAANMNISTYTVWRMLMKLLHMLEKMIEDTVASGEIELDEKYVLNSHKGEKR